MSHFGYAQWSWPRNERLVTNDVASGISQSFMFFLCLLDDRIASPTSVCLFFVKETSSALLKQWLPELQVEGFHDSWHDVTTHSETQTLFSTDSQSTSLGMAEVGTLKLDLRELKSRNTIIFFIEYRYLFTRYRATITTKTMFTWQYRHFNLKDSHGKQCFNLFLEHLRVWDSINCFSISGVISAEKT